MKRLIICSALALFVFSSCDSPVNNLNGDRQQSTTPDNLSSQIPPGTPPARADSIRKAAFQQFKSRHGPEWRVTWNAKTGLPLTVFSGTTEPVPGASEQAARSFLTQHRTLFGMRGDLADLQLIEVGISSRGIRHVRFQQTFQGIPVYEGDYQVHIRPDGRIDMANGHYYPDIDVSTSPGVSKSDARQSALADLGGQVEVKKEQEIETLLMIYRRSEYNTFALAWRVLVPAVAPVPGTWQYFVDAGNGQILSKLDLDPSVTGDGDIIEDTPELTPTPVTSNLYRLDGSGYLRGTYANVHNAIDNRAFSSVNSFQYATGNTHFDEVNVYYHIDTFRHNYLNVIGFAGKNIGSDQDLEAWVHDQERPNAAHYDPGAHEVAFGINTDFARRDVVIYHEFIHAAADVENGSHYLDPNETEEGAIGEGISDYFGGSYQDRSEHLNRDMANPGIATYGEYQNNLPVEEHVGGEFFSAILWDLRNSGEISNHDADVIIFEAISRLSGSPNFIEYRDAMMAVDSDVNGGIYNDLIQDTFAGRGIGTYSPLDVVISGPSSISAGENGTWTASASGGNGSYTYTWYRRPLSTSGWSFIGSGTQYSGTGQEDFELLVEAEDTTPRTGEDLHSVLVIGGCKWSCQ